MSEIVDRVIYEANRYDVEPQTDGSFAIMDGYRDVIVRGALTADDEPHDICDAMNGRAAIEALRQPPPTVIALLARMPNDLRALGTGGRSGPEWLQQRWSEIVDALLE